MSDPTTELELRVRALELLVMASLAHREPHAPFLATFRARLLALDAAQPLAPGSPGLSIHEAALELAEAALALVDARPGSTPP